MPISSDVNLKEIALATQNYSGADLAALCREAAVEAMQLNLTKITSKNFASGLKRIKPSISKDVETWYDKIKEGVSILYQNKEIGKILINNNYPFGLIKCSNNEFDFKNEFKTEKAIIKIRKPDWIQK